MSDQPYLLIAVALVCFAFGILSGILLHAWIRRGDQAEWERRLESIDLERLGEEVGQLEDLLDDVYRESGE